MNTRSMNLKICAALLGLAIHTQASAAVWCAGPVTDIIVNQNGYLQANWGYTNIILCNVSTDTAPPSPLTPITQKTCSTIASMLLTAQATGKQFMALLPSDSTCAGWAPNGNWSTKLISDYRLSP